jgi:RimJ/RimL family protein N-acetyltransferase
MIRGEKVLLRARVEADVPILHAGLEDDVITRSRSDSRPWRPVAAAHSQFLPAADDPSATPFTVVELASDSVAGAAVLWGIDTHNRVGHVGLSLLPSARGKGLAVDVVRRLCWYGIQVRGLHRLQIETLTDNEPMIRTALGAGFSREATLRESAWVLGEFRDEAIFGLLAGGSLPL